MNDHHGLYSHHYHAGAFAVFVFLLAFLIAWLILAFYNPKYVQRTVHGHATGVTDYGKVLVWSLVIAFIVLFVLALLWYAFRQC